MTRCFLNKRRHPQASRSNRRSSPGAVQPDGVELGMLRRVLSRPLGRRRPRHSVHSPDHEDASAGVSVGGISQPVQSLTLAKHTRGGKTRSDGQRPKWQPKPVQRYLTVWMTIPSGCPGESACGTSRNDPPGETRAHARRRASALGGRTRCDACSRNTASSITKRLLMPSRSCRGSSHGAPVGTPRCPHRRSLATRRASPPTNRSAG